MTRYLELLAPNGAVTTPLPAASQAGIDVLQNGGSATDAAIAALSVQLTARADMVDRQPLLDVLVWDPARAALSGLRSASGDIELRLTISAILKRFGCRSFSDLSAPAVAYARKRLLLGRPESPENAAHLWLTSDKPLTEPPATNWCDVESGQLLRFEISAPFASPGTVDLMLEPLRQEQPDPPPPGSLTSFMVRNPVRGKPAARAPRDVTPWPQVIAVDHRGMTASISAAPFDAAAGPVQIVVSDAGKPVLWVAGAAGDEWTMVDITKRALDSGLHVQAAIESPRHHCPRLGDGQPAVDWVCAERSRSRAAEDFERKMAEQRLRVRWQPRFDRSQGSVQAIAIDRRRGLLRAGADPRWGGQAAGY
ncbi:MAG TPA: hypothetical protein VFB34_05360 [Chloroflexota bacterium]|nr:hypothetical protein [Chloroflexota bacterium]